MHNIDKDSIWNIIRYYIENKKCSETAVEILLRRNYATDRRKTEKLLKLRVTTENSELRQHYR
jgi:hypothetical protein